MNRLNFHESSAKELNFYFNFLFTYFLIRILVGKLFFDLTVLFTLRQTLVANLDVAQMTRLFVRSDGCMLENSLEFSISHRLLFLESYRWMNMFRQ